MSPVVVALVEEALRSGGRTSGFVCPHVGEGIEEQEGSQSFGRVRRRRREQGKRLVITRRWHGHARNASLVTGAF